MKLYAHPFSSYCQKVLIPLYENGVAFEYCQLGNDDAVAADHVRLWPLKKMPVLDDAGHTLVEASIIIEHLDLHHAGRVRMLPADPKPALEVRMLDRFFDNYVMTPMQKIVGDFLRPTDQRDAYGVADAHAQLDVAYRWLERTLQGRQWAAGDAFTLADCAAAPSLFYADWVHPIDDSLQNLRNYRARLLKRPSFARAVDEARPFRKYFPPGAPDRD
jgi:glutathione S-transferase